MAAFHGLRLTRPIRSMPRYLKSANDQWIHNVEYLIDRCAVVVMDLTDASASIGIELRLLPEHDAHGKALLLVREDKANEAVALLATATAGRLDCWSVLVYRATGRAAIGRIVNWVVLVIVKLPALAGLVSEAVMSRGVRPFIAGLTSVAMFAYAGANLLWLSVRIALKKSLNRSDASKISGAVRRLVADAGHERFVSLRDVIPTFIGTSTPESARRLEEGAARVSWLGALATLTIIYLAHEASGVYGPISALSALAAIVSVLLSAPREGIGPMCRRVALLLFVVVLPILLLLSLGAARTAGT